MHIYIQTHRLVQTHTIAPVNIHLPQTHVHTHTCTPEHTSTDTHSTFNLPWHSSLALDRDNYSVNFNVRQTKMFFFGYLLLPFLFVFFPTFYNVQTHSVFPIGYRGISESRTSGERLPRIPRCSAASPSRSQTSPSLAFLWDLEACTWSKLGLF